MLKAIIAAIVMGFSLNVLAHIPPSEYLVQTWVKKHAGIKEVKIKSHLKFYEDGIPIEPGYQVITVFDSRKNQIDVFGTGPGNLKVFSFTKKKLSAMGRLLMDPNFSRVAQELKEIEVPLQLKSEISPESLTQSPPGELPEENTHIARLKSQLYWVIGNHQSAESPQLWIEKDLFTPLRLTQRATGGWRVIELDSIRYFREFPILRNAVIKDMKGEIQLREEIIEVNFSDTGFSKINTAGEGTPLSGRSEKALREYEELLR